MSPGETVGVLVATSLARTIGVAKIDGHLVAFAESCHVRELGTVVEGDALEESREIISELLPEEMEDLGHVPCFFARHEKILLITGFPLGQDEENLATLGFPDDAVALPVTEILPRVDFGRA